ncbi:MAG: LicD family protein [Coprobacter sp.]|nr:LicD family protein [Coprobacter sp.]
MPKQYSLPELEQLHEVLYEILAEVVRVCDKYDIPYFVIGGTAIGALYDKAILPWDDDIDIGMKREDYEYFLRVAPGELNDAYFLSWLGTDPHTPYHFTKVKKKNTLFVEENYRDIPMHQGIFVDIFPFDRIPDNKWLRRIQFEAVNFLKCCLIGKEIWQWKHCGTCQVASPSDRGWIPCFLNRVVDIFFSKKAIYKMMRFASICFNSSRTTYYNHVITKTDHISQQDIETLGTIPFGPLSLKAPVRLELFLRYNYPTLHRYTDEEQDKRFNHYPMVLSFDAKKDGLEKWVKRET